MNLVFLLTHVPNPRMNKRMTVAETIANTTVVCARRKSQNVYEPKINSVKHYIFDIDLPSSKHLLKRWVLSQKYQKCAGEKLRELAPDIIYAEGLDSLMIAVKYRKSHPNTRVFFEVADLRECFIEKSHNVWDRFSTYLISDLEKRLFFNVEHLIVTSIKFYECHYFKLISRERVIFIPNTPDLAAFVGYAPKNGGDFTVGFIGGIRYLRQMKMLVDAAEKVGCKVLLAGAGGTSTDYQQITAYCQGKDFVTFTGKYDYDSEIAGLYGLVDCVYAVYDADNANVKIALPNKLYEAIYCELPIIVAKGTYLVELVEKWRVGVAVSHTDGKELAEALLHLKNDTVYYEEIRAACHARKSAMDFSKYQNKLKTVFAESHGTGEDA